MSETARKTTRFKVGQKVRVVKCADDPKLIGKIGVVFRIGDDETFPYAVNFSRWDIQDFRADELEAINE